MNGVFVLSRYVDTLDQQEQKNTTMKSRVEILALARDWFLRDRILRDCTSPLKKYATTSETITVRRLRSRLCSRGFLSRVMVGCTVFVSTTGWAATFLPNLTPSSIAPFVDGWGVANSFYGQVVLIQVDPNKGIAPVIGSYANYSPSVVARSGWEWGNRLIMLGAPNAYDYASASNVFDGSTVASGPSLLNYGASNLSLSMSSTDYIFDTSPYFQDVAIGVGQAQWPYPENNQPPGPTGVAYQIVSAGTKGVNRSNFAQDGGSAFTSGGDGGQITAAIYDSLFDARGRSSLASPYGKGSTNGSGLAWEPAAGGVYLASIGGDGGASNDLTDPESMAGGNGGTVSLQFTNSQVTFNNAQGLARQTFNGITLVSQGGNSGNCCVMEKQSDGKPDWYNNGNIWMAEWDYPLGFSKDEMNAWDGSTVTGNYGSGIQGYGSNGNGGPVQLELGNSSVKGSGTFLIGLSASSVGGAIELPPEMNGIWKYQRIGRGDIPGGGKGQIYASVYDSSLSSPQQPLPGSSDSVTVTLQDSFIDLNGSNLIGIYAASTTEPFFVLTNVASFSNENRSSGYVEVDIDAASSVSVTNDGTSPSYQGVSIAVAAISAGGYLSSPFDSNLYVSGSNLYVSGGITDKGVPISSRALGVGASSSVNVSNDGTITASGQTAIGVLALSAANSAAASSANALSSTGGQLYKPSHADTVTVTNSGRIVVTGDMTVGIMAGSVGSGGLVHSLESASTRGSEFIHGGAGFAQQRRIQQNFTTAGGWYPSIGYENLGFDQQMYNGADVTVNNLAGASIQVGNADRSSRIAYGIIAQSIGHAGGTVLGGASAQIGSKEGGGGHGGSVTVDNHGSLTVLGESAVGVLAQSIGGGGGAGANSDSWFVALGASGGAGGNGGGLSLNFYEGSSVVTNGDFAVGVIGHSIGGGGGHGGGAKSHGAFFDVATGGSGGDGGHGGNVAISSDGKVFRTAGQHAHGLILQSIGGGGGVGGAANSHSAGVILAVSVATGGTGGAGGNGGTIQGKDLFLTPIHADIITNAHDSAGIILQSVGGGGGTAGAATAKSLAIGLGTFDPELSEVPSIGVSFAQGGSGGLGGHGGEVNYWHVGNVSTYGNHSPGIMAHSIGGGGGSGSDGTASSHTAGVSDVQLNLSFGLGGKAAFGGDGGNIYLPVGPQTATAQGATRTSDEPTTIRTAGHDSIAIFAQSVGGGGGNAGTGSGFDLSVQFTPKAGDDPADDDTKGQAGGDDVGDLNDFNGLPGYDDASSFDNDASSTAGELPTSKSKDEGGSTDSKEDSNDSSKDSPEEKTLFSSAMACLKKVLKTNKVSSALGDCDEDAPSKPSSKGVNLDVNVGRAGAGGGVGGQIEVYSSANAFTAGSGSHAIFAQTVGGGGGKASPTGADASGGKINATINVGAQSGSGADGGKIYLNSSGTIVTGQLYDLANPTETDPTKTDPTKFVAPSVIGGDAHGIFAQSIGGGGGVGGTADPHSSAASSAIIDLINGKYETAALTAMGVSSTDIKDLSNGLALLKWGLLGTAPNKFSFSPTVNVGGAGGAAGDGGAVNIGNSGSIRTFGHRSFGVFAQSIGGGGGAAGSANGALIDVSGKETMSGINFDPSINVGGAGGAGGDGGEVTYTSSADSAIVTRGYASYGIALQSIGGGGGVAHEGSTFGLSDTVGLDSAVSVTGGVDFGNGTGKASYSASANGAKANGSIAFGKSEMQNGKLESTNSDSTSKDFGTSTYSNESAGNSGSGDTINLGFAVNPLLGSIETHGDDAMAVFGQSIGGGGGLATMGCSNAAPTDSSHYASACWGNTQVSSKYYLGQPDEFVGLGGTNGVAITVNAGTYSSENDTAGSGDINVYSNQRITTYGARSMGIVAQSITGGGGFFSGPNRRIHSVDMPTHQRVANSSPGAVSIGLSGSTITTYGDGAWGVFAQMVQGGGGFFGDSSQDLAFNVKSSQGANPVQDVFVGNINQNQAQYLLPYASTLDQFSNSAMKVTLGTTSILTNGKNAHGMVLQNLGSVGGVWSSNGKKLHMGINLHGNNANGNTPGGKVSLTLAGSTVDAKGVNARGVVIQSDGAGPGGIADQGQITVNINNQSRIKSYKHTALMIVGGSFSTTTSEQNTVNVNSGTVQSGSYMAAAAKAIDNTDAGYNLWAVYAPTGYTNINLTAGGSIHGNVLLGIVTKGEFWNMKGGGWHGSTAIVANNSLHNYGTIYAGGEGGTGGLFIDGSLKHYEGGEIHVDVHPLGDAESHDVITVTGLARMEGEIVPQTKSLLPGNYQFLNAGTLEHSGSVRDAHVFSWDATVDGNSLTKTPTANFAPAGFSLTGNQASLAGYLQRGWDSGEREKGYLFGYLHEHDDGAHGDYQATLDQLMGQTLNAQPIQFQTAFSTYMSESLSCPTVTEQGLRLNQDNCAWAKVTGDISDQSANSSNPGFRATGGGIRLGAQKRLGNGWSAGFGAGYALNYLTSTNFSSNGQFLDLSVSAKKQIEQWEFGGSLGYAQGWFESNRYRAMGANGAADAMDGVFASDSRMSIMGLRLRAAYEHELDKDHYLKPYVDVDLSYSSMPGYSETGTAPLALNVGSSSRWNVAITPMLEYGLDVITEDKSRVKLFASAGASFLPNNSHKSETSFAGASAALGTFDVITDGPEILGRLNLGIQAFHSDDLEVRAQYGLLAGDGYWSQSLSANLVWRF